MQPVEYGRANVRWKTMARCGWFGANGLVRMVLYDSVESRLAARLSERPSIRPSIRPSNDTRKRITSLANQPLAIRLNYGIIVLNHV